MGGFLELIALSCVMGFSIYLSLPIVLKKAVRSRTITLLNAAAIGILIFLLADIWGDVAPTIYSNPSNPYVASPTYFAIFLVAVAACYLVLFASEHPPGGRHRPQSPMGLSLIVAGAIGFQNLTEGLVFGAAWSSGLLALSTVVLVGFSIQNVTEGFPITAPLVGQKERRLSVIAGILFLGGFPTIAGAALGYFYSSPELNLVFDSLAIGAILYTIVPMLRISFRPSDPPEPTYLKQRLVYLGLLLGFLVGFAVNAI
jgi:zinc transporter, ZIP family